jgi:hypothetical protein
MSGPLAGQSGPARRTEGKRSSARTTREARVCIVLRARITRPEEILTQVRQLRLERAPNQERRLPPREWGGLPGA